MKNDEIHRFDAIINLPHHTSSTRPGLSAWSRAAQFSPFAALTGYEDAVEETARVTAVKTELDEEAKEILNRRLYIIRRHLENALEVTFTYFVPDEYKNGGRYTTVAGVIKKFDDYRHLIRLTDGTEIAIEDILDIDSELFRNTDLCEGY